MWESLTLWNLLEAFFHLFPLNLQLLPSINAAIEEAETRQSMLKISRVVDICKETLLSMILKKHCSTFWGRSRVKG